MSLREWQRSGWLVEHRTSAEEIADLLGVAQRDLEQSQVSALAPDWRLAIAYNAALQAATALLAAAGYRAARQAHHYRVIQSLGLTAGWDKGRIAQLDTFRKKRNIGNYERAGLVSETEAARMRELAQELLDETLDWLGRNHPRLLPPDI